MGRDTDAETSPIELVIDAREKDLGGFSVRRVLPFPRRRHVGPFVFFDHIGPAELPPGSALDVRPHPHINLATVTFLFEGEIVHKDSLGSDRAIRPGAINWMTAGRGIVHSERQSAEERARGPKIHGIQIWIALPEEHEETAPEFIHYPAEVVPKTTRKGANLTVLVGEAFDLVSPVKTFSPMFYVDAQLEDGAELEVPDNYRERAVYLVSGRVSVAGNDHDAPCMLVCREGTNVRVRALGATHLVLLGGAPVGERHMFWNFVSSRPERIEQAKDDWKNRRFELVPGDEVEFIPLPEG